MIIWINVFMLAGYTVSCHACRHVWAGGSSTSRSTRAYRFWTSSPIQRQHGTFAMVSLVTVIVTDAYIMSVSAGWITDFRFVN